MGGIERYLLQAGQALSARGVFEPVFVCSENTPLYQQLKSFGLSVYGLKSSGFFSKSFLRSFDFFALLELKRIMQAEKPDVTHVHIGLLETLLPKRWGYPVVFTFHGYGSLYSDRLTQNPVKRVFKNLVKFVFQKTANGLDNLLIVSKAEQDRLLREGFLTGKNAGAVIHNGVPIADIQRNVLAANPAIIRKKLGLRGDSRVISYINRLDSNKNPAHFLAMAEHFASQPEFVDCQFLVAGDGPLKQSIEAASGELPNVSFLGYWQDISEIFSITDVLIYPALAEGFGLGLVEAMAAGVPCVAYASEGAGEILGSPETAGCLVPVGDLTALENRLKAMLRLSDAQKEALKAALQNRAKAFELKDSIQKLESVYHHLTPKISILLPVYNGAGYVMKAVNSVLKQTYPHWELIIVDDGSTDGTLARLATIDDKRVQVIRQENQGVAIARNFGFTQATGDYIAFIDADDVWLPGKLAEEINVIRAKTTPEKPACLVYSSYFAVDDDNRLVNLPGIHTKSGNLAEAVLSHEGIFLPSTAMVHRSVFGAVGGFKSACYHEDHVFFIQACQKFPAYPTGKRLVLYRQSLSGRCRSVLKNYDEALAAELSIVTTLRETLAESELSLLSIRQTRNLLFRFLMYNYLQPARQLYDEMRKKNSAPAIGDLFQGKKGQLAMLSLSMGINYLFAARLLVQGLMKAIPLVILSPACRPVLAEETRSC